ncbi:uncharacterized protein PV09_07813 [Verruconis gallopava]|uniref:Uncharacterized protein n=1 Tax=Verruconis gallopava TaxID=253628 RepID=A0A0D1XEK7_9PEZI|nr:uncharacterized protein PV09_07813 [Verruconis gallopava]KIW00616.1 hypothetical protein PV09_07813 [Verruconis gallopava]
MSALDVTENNFVPDQLVDQLVKGYDALSVEIKVLDDQRRDLENRLSWAKQQYLDALKRFSPTTASQDFRTFLDELDEAGICEASPKSLDWLASAQRSTDPDRQNRAYNIQRAADAREKIRFRRRASDAAAHANGAAIANVNDVRIWNGKSADPPLSPMEKDFTTYNGTPGRLKCPFVAPNGQSGSLLNGGTNAINGMSNGIRTPKGSSMSRASISGRRSKRSSFHDPIRAEICGFDQSNSNAASIDGSVPLCPIRFLDQHSPEEVAQYFERHKHELPRSHELCVKRYQSNEASIRELDKKYGTLVTMIQGLGQVHQPMLPETPEDDTLDQNDGVEGGSKARVEKWASTVTESLKGVDEIPVDDVSTGENGEMDEREPHFDRPLKDVRVGESPSRPWGIAVPDVDELDGGRAARSDHTASPRDTPIPPPTKLPESPVKSTTTTTTTTREPGRCPFDHKMLSGMANLMPGTPHTNHNASAEAVTAKPESHIPPMMAESVLPKNGRSPAADEPELPQGTKVAAAATTAPPSAQPPAPQLVFNGPVFFGYNMDQALAMLQASGIAGKVA